MKDRRRFAVLMQAVCAAHRVEPTEALLEAYWLAGDGVADEDFARAAHRAIRDRVHMPKPAEMRELAGVETAALRAVRAFESLRAALSRFGVYRSVRFADPRIHATVRALGGWVSLGQQDAEEFQKWTRREFIRVYEALEGQRLDGTPDHLPGLDETHNLARGFPVPTPVLVNDGGDERRRELGEGPGGVALGVATDRFLSEAEEGGH